jgi:hypothetical protein
VYPLLGGLIPGSSGGGVWLVDIVVLPMGLQTPSAPSVLSLILPLETPHTVQWLAARIELCICKDLAGPLRRQLYQAPFSKHFFFIFLFFFIMYFPQLHFQCYPTSPPDPPPPPANPPQPPPPPVLPDLLFCLLTRKSGLRESWVVQHHSHRAYMV